MLLMHYEYVYEREFMSYLSVKNLTISYNGFLALKDVSFTLRENTVTAIVGVNGAGKTSLLKAISGINTNYSGDILINDASINNLDLLNRVYKKIVLVPEGREVFETLTVKENLIVGGFTVKNSNKLVEGVLSEFNEIKYFGNRLAGKLSGGQQQFVAIARAMMINPKILLVDEPTMGLTPKNSTIILNYLKDLTKRDITVIISSSTFKNKEKGFDRIISLQNGKISSEK